MDFKIRWGSSPAPGRIRETTWQAARSGTVGQHQVSQSLVHACHKLSQRGSLQRHGVTRAHFPSRLDVKARQCDHRHQWHTNQHFQLRHSNLGGHHFTWTYTLADVCRHILSINFLTQHSLGVLEGCQLTPPAPVGIPRLWRHQASDITANSSPIFQVSPKRILTPPDPNMAWQLAQRAQRCLVRGTRGPRLLTQTIRCNVCFRCQGVIAHFTQTRGAHLLTMVQSVPGSSACYIPNFSPHCIQNSSRPHTPKQLSNGEGNM